LLPVAPSAHATFPGANGKIAYEGSGGIWTVNPDGSGASPLPNGASDDVGPAWSPDGTKIAFNTNVSPPSVFPNYEIFTMNANGTGRTRLTNYADQDGGAAWSPDGTKIAFSRQLGSGVGEQIFVMNADGTGVTQLTSGTTNVGPAWSPDGTKIAFVRGFADIWTMNPDGTGATNVTNRPGVDKDGPNWSPDGTKIAYAQNDDPNTIDCQVCDWDIHVVNADGTGDVRIANHAKDSEPAWSPDGTKIAFYTFRDEPDPLNCVSCNFAIYTMSATGANPTRLVAGSAPDWQPIPINAYPRPKGATPFKTFLVPAYKQCTAPDRTHGAPLAFGSCSSPQQTSSYLTVGTPDSNGLAPASRGFVQYTTVLGNPSTPANEADLQIDVSIVGVLNKVDLTPYSGQLSADAGLRITDKNNTPSPGGPGAATVQDGSFPVTVPCTSSSCSVSTTANALVPGAALEGKRAVWQLGHVKVYDGGSDGLASTTADNTLFMDQGIFIP
jgi:Tol biopolymer transport system component